MSAWDSFLKEIERKENEIEGLKAEIESLKERIETVKTLPLVCTECGGSGEARYTDAAGSMSWDTCRLCHGLGRIGDVKCTCGFVVTTEMTAIRRKRHPECPVCGRTINLY